MTTPMTVLANEEGSAGIAAAAEALRAGRSALDAVEQGIRLVEADPSVRTVGYGGAPNLLGQVECDASIMDGATLRSGAVGALRGYLHAISVARAVMENLPHVLLVGEGAARYAAEIGAERSQNLTPQAEADYRAWVERRVPHERRPSWPDLPLAPYAWPEERADIARAPALGDAKAVGKPSYHGTTAFMAIDGHGHLAGGVSTSGWAYKYPGRLGDSPIIGAGLYVDERYGACGCTHTGEMTIRAGTARSVVLYMKMGASVEEACHEALDDLAHLRGGYLGAVLIHAMDREGKACVIRSRDTGVNRPYWFWRDGMAEAMRGEPLTGADN